MSRVGVSVMYIIFFLMFRRPPRSTRTDTLFPYTTLFRSATASGGRLVVHARGHEVARPQDPPVSGLQLDPGQRFAILAVDHRIRSEEHTSELQSLMRISYAVFCLKKKINTT